jgi:protein-disulfide isomerase
MKLPAVLAAALLLAGCDGLRSPEPYTVVTISPFLGQPVMGDPNAPVTLTEYASTTCGHCKAFHDQVFPELKAKYIDTGKMKLAWMVMPTQPNAVSLAGAALARCTGEAHFFDVIDTLFDKQEDLFAAAGEPWKLQQELRAIGGKFGLSPDQVGTCIDDRAILEATRKGVAEAPPEITGTPSFVIAGKKLELESLEDLTAAIDAELAKTAAPAATP